MWKHATVSGASHSADVHSAPSNPPSFWQVGRTMRSFDPMAAAIDWLDAYRANDLSIIDLYAPDASLECGCNGRATITGRNALTEYWRQRFVERPAGELDGLQMDGRAVVVSYAAPEGTVRARLGFNDAGEIVHSECGPVRV